MASERDKFVEEVRAAGFRFHRHSKHQDLYVDDWGKFVGIAHTPSDVRGILNERAVLRRHLKARQGAPMPEPLPVPPILQQVTYEKAAAQQEATPFQYCKICSAPYPVESYTKAGFGRVKTCSACLSKIQVEAWGKRRAKSAAAEKAKKPEDKAPRSITPPPPLMSLLAPPSDVTQAQALHPSSKGDPEAQAVRILIRRHKAEYDQLVEEQMAALGWE